MTTRLNTAWIKVGSSVTSPVENTQRAQVLLDSYYVVVGFEVNNPKAYVDNVHDLAVDYGHAFIYVVKNVTIVKSFSFGPSGPGKVGWFNKGRVMTSKKNGIHNGRPGNADYIISERVKAFKVDISLQQAVALQAEIDKLRSEILDGSLEYSAIMNDTCAETAKEALDEAYIPTPSGSGWIKDSRRLSFPIVYAVNPYTWHANFKRGQPEAEFVPDEPVGWLPIIGDDDPIFGVPTFARADPIFGARL